MSDDINLPPLPRVQVPLIEADVSLLDIRVLARWCERIATDHARAAVLADRASRAAPPQQDDARDREDAERYRVLKQMLPQLLALAAQGGEG
ncbi:hypothetical protein [Pandoraea sp. CB10b_02]|uniref:hypothetical protein n=1 Tax=Pandoraea sp. CB10b_02 TaxID=2014535 RepID=UPI002580E46C|nr:hypothetical protein [Pandoraea sp. CB10b_02]